MVNLRLTDKFKFLSQFRKKIRFPNRSSLIEKSQISKMSKRRNKIHPVSKSNILTYLRIHLLVNSLVYDRLHTHILQYIFNWEIKRNTILVVFNQLSLLLEQSRLLEKKFLVESD